MTAGLSDLTHNVPRTSSEGENASPLGIQEYLGEHTPGTASRKRNPESVLAESIFEVCIYLPVVYLKMGSALMDVNCLFAQKSPANLINFA